MHQNRENQLPLSGLWPHHQLAQELKAISKILDDNPSISDLLLHDLCDSVSCGHGAPHIRTTTYLTGGGSILLDHDGPFSPCHSEFILTF